MIEKIVENWLTSTNERGYEIPFCQCLMLEGYTIIHVSKHGQMEQGKDIIALNPDGMPCVYQLKSGDINLTRWRKMQGEIQELTELPINHPIIDKTKSFQAFLVTNGAITDTVRRWIDDRNTDWEKKGLPIINIIVGTQLLRKFTDIHESFFPETPIQLKDFLELYIADGRDLLKRPKLASLLEIMLFRDDKYKVNSSSALQRRVSNAAVITQYTIAPFEKEENHVGIVESWTMLCAYIFALAERENLHSKYWRKTYDIVMQRINEQLENLKTKFLSMDNYLEGQRLGDGGVVYKARMTMVVGWLCAYELHRLRFSEDAKPDKKILQVVKRYKNEFWYWGESATPYYLMMSLLCEVVGEEELSGDIFSDVLVELCEGNVPKTTIRGVPNPYIFLEDIIGAEMKLPGFYVDRTSFVGLSYHLSPLTYFATRRNKRAALNELWPKISKICLCEYEPRYKWHYTTWISKQGKEKTRFYNITQSWKELKELAIRKEKNLPNILYKNPEFLYFFLLVFPHRLTSESMRLIDENVHSNYLKT